MTDTTQFIIILALSAAIGGWAITQIVMSLRRWETRRLQRRLNSEFKVNLVAPVSPILTDLPGDALKGLVGKTPQLLKLSEKLEGVWPKVTVQRFLYIALACAMIVGASADLALDSLLGSFIGALFGAWLPMVALNYCHGRRRRILNDQLCDALEFLSRALRAGHSFSTGIQMMADELPQPIAGQFQHVHDQQSLGMPMEKSLTEMAERAGSTDFAFFVTAVLIQRQTGGDLAEILDNISEMVRNRIRLQQHVKALTAEGRLSGYILSAFPMLMLGIIFILNREYAMTLFKTQLGQILLVCSFIMQALGLVLIRRIITISV